MKYLRKANLRVSWLAAVLIYCVSATVAFAEWGSLIQRESNLYALDKNQYFLESVYSYNVDGPGYAYISGVLNFWDRDGQPIGQFSIQFNEAEAGSKPALSFYFGNGQSGCTVPHSMCDVLKKIEPSYREKKPAPIDTEGLSKQVKEILSETVQALHGTPLETVATAGPALIVKNHNTAEQVDKASGSRDAPTTFSYGVTIAEDAILRQPLLIYQESQSSTNYGYSGSASFLGYVKGATPPLAVIETTVTEASLGAYKQVRLLPLSEKRLQSRRENVLGLQSLKQGDFRVALSHFKASLKADPEYLHAHFNTTCTLSLSKRPFRDGKKHLERLLGDDAQKAEYLRKIKTDVDLAYWRNQSPDFAEWLKKWEN